jgi:hypothetical protein
VQVRVGDDWVASLLIPAIDEALEVIADAEGEPPLGEILPNDVLVEVGGEGVAWRTRARIAAGESR